MREPLRDNGRLLHIIEAIDNAFEFTNGVSFGDYSTNKLLRFATVKNIEIVGEAAYMLSKPFKEQHPEVQWDDVVAMRHVLVHGYYQIKDDRVWHIIQNDLPQLRERVKGILATESNNPPDGLNVQ
ncbi:DUF86 domain-containing protein [Bacteroidia bacterium]|nr:DUF86 domain-containing protein [Bacteroidia bacterium]